MALPNLDAQSVEAATNRIPTIKIEDAKNWYETQLKKDENNSFSLKDGSTLFLPNALPNWQEAESDFSKNGLEYVVTPIKNEWSSINGDAKLLIFKNATQKLAGMLMMYLPDEAYRERTKGEYDPTTFTGIIVYTDFTGHVFLSLKIVDGSIEKEYTATKTSGSLVNRGVSACLTIPGPCPQAFSSSGCSYTFCDCSGNCNPNGKGGVGPGGSSVPGYNFNIGAGPISAGGGTSGHTGGSSSGGGGSSNWGNGQPANSFNNTTQVINQLISEGFPSNEVDDLGFTAAKGLYFSWSKYRDIGFDIDEFRSLKSNAVFFSQVNAFLNQKGFNRKTGAFVKAYIDSYENDPEFKEMVSAPIPGFLADIAFDVAIEVVEKIVKKYIPAAELSEDVINAIRALRGDSWMDVLYAAGELAWDTAKTLNPELALLKTFDAFKEANSLYKKFNKMKDSFHAIYNNVDAATFKKIYAAMSKLSNRNVFDKFQFLEEQGYKNFKYFGSARDLMNKMANEFGESVSDLTPLKVNPLDKTFGFKTGNIYFSFYIESGTLKTPTVHIAKNGFGNPTGNGDTIIKIRQ